MPNIVKPKERVCFVYKNKAALRSHRPYLFKVGVGVKTRLIGIQKCGAPSRKLFVSASRKLSKKNTSSTNSTDKGGIFMAPFRRDHEGKVPIPPDQLEKWQGSKGLDV
ncbi:hypothetical protein TNIN_10841 [Trichonephila inaurata madagascariensis]|uniref:Uncharacterized protein n=1 Tax=Trichonephila inaurata madagascariensis TaxID=2747483 RepID=A0A8X7C5Z7_9ARAC|nr:hypothetical protein TNIN_10841 [Trichonephila inaurata madagascariensis]